MHIGFLTPEYPHPATTVSAGLGSSIENLANALVLKGMKVSVFIYGQEKDSVFENEGVNLHLIKQRKYKFFGWFLYRKFLQNYINSIIGKESIQIIEAPDWTGITAFMKLNCPLIIRMHGSDSYFCKLENRPQKKKNFYFEKRALTRADHLLSVSKFTAAKTADIFDLQKQITIIPNAVNIEFFKPQTGSVKLGSILYFGSIIRKKGVLELAGIFNKIIEQKPETTLTLLGNNVVDIYERRSTYQLFLELLSPAAKERVSHIPGVRYNEVRKHLNSAAVVVLPSYAEALPMTWLEAMSMEKALVTSNIGWAPEVMVNNVTGYMERPDDHNSFSDKILKILNDPGLAEEFGKAAREKVISDFSTAGITEKNIKFYKSIIEVD